MNEQTQQRLAQLGLRDVRAVLEREDAFFALLDQDLLYHDSRGTRRISLRDLTRIHSDDQGMLRIETPAGTGLGTTLVGFVPEEVQPFFCRCGMPRRRPRPKPRHSCKPRPLPPPSVAPSIPPLAGPGSWGQATPAAESRNSAQATAGQARVAQPAAAPLPGTPAAPVLFGLSPASPAQTPAPRPQAPTVAWGSPAQQPADAPPPATPSTAAAPADPAPQPAPQEQGTPEDALLVSEGENLAAWPGRLRALAALLILGALGMGAFQWCRARRSAVSGHWCPAA
ncbi:hypothetical protein ACFP81_11465 [Deinococcus lacus]|uniref:Uncharacterized protein n=1 Tax=Deinococcus lacus TaxID=392561 RepID=A0ABW1Y8E0_9DEIO